MNGYKFLLDVVLGAVVCQTLMMLSDWYSYRNDLTIRQQVAAKLLCWFIGVPLALGIGWMIGIVNL